MRLVLDTNVLIYGVTPPADAEVAVAAVSYAELEAGVWMTDDPVTQALRQTQLLEWRRVLGSGLPFDDAASASFGLLTRVVRAAGRTSTRRSLDLMIAATAHANGAGVLTRNVRDFAGLERLVPVVEA